MDALISPGRRRLVGTFGACGVLAGLGALAGCGQRTPPSAGLQFGGQTMGTRYTVKLAGAALSAGRLDVLQATVHDALDGVNRGMTLYRADSELMHFNRQPADAPLALSSGLFAVFAAAQQVSQLSAGAFDISVAPLVQAWGFGPDKHQRVPAADMVQASRAPLGWQGLQIDTARGTVTKSRGDLQADLGGIAKGHAVDLAARALEAAGHQDYMIEVGGEVRTRGRNAQGQPWQIGIEEPDAMPPRARRVVPLSGPSLATSGDYRICYEVAGRRYSHAIDPRTAAPIAHGLASVSVVADSCMRADALATALIVMGPQRGLALAQQLALPALFIVRGADGRLRDIATPAFEALAPVA